MLNLRGGLKHTFWSLLDTISYPVVYFAATPFLIRYMGTAPFGFWMVLNTVIVVLQLFNFNLGFTAMRHIAQERATGNRNLVADIINSVLQITLAQFAGIAVIGSALVLILSTTDSLRAYAGHIPSGALCFGLAALLGGLKYFEQIFQNIIKSYERYRSAAILNMFFRIGSLAVTLAVAIAVPGKIVYVLAANIGFSLCYLGVHYGYIHRVLPYYRIAPVRSEGLQRRLLSYSMWPWLQSIIVVLTFQADRFWVSAYAGFAEVSSYALVATMFNHIHMIFAATVAWISPRIIATYAAGQNPERMYHLVRSLLAVVSIVSLLLFYWISPVLFPLWVGDDTYLRLKVYIQGFTAFELAFVHTIMPLFFLNGTGRERQATYITLISCGVCYVLMLAGLRVFDSPAALVLGMAIGALLTTPAFNIAADFYASGRKATWRTLPESLPVLAAMALLYTTSPWLRILLTAGGGWAFWTYFLSDLTKPHLWTQVFNSGKSKG